MKALKIASVWMAVVAPCLILLALQPRSVAGFVAPSSSKNITTFGFKKILSFPLDLDTALSAKDDDSNSSDEKPRGVVLNAAVGSLVAAGGLLGFVTKGSKASLAAGTTFGGLLLGASVWIARGARAGNRLGAVVASFLFYTMGKKFLKSGKFIPSGLIAASGLLAVVYNVYEGFVAKGTNGTNKEKSNAE